MENLKVKIKKLRVIRGLSQAELAAMSGLSQPAVGAIESGKKSPTLRTLQKLAAALGVSITDLLEEDTRPTGTG